MVQSMFVNTKDPTLLEYEIFTSLPVHSPKVLIELHLLRDALNLLRNSSCCN